MRRKKGQSEAEPDFKGFESSDDSSQGSGAENQQQVTTAAPRPTKSRGAPTKSSAPSNDDDGDIDQSTVIYLGRIPHGFHEHEMRAYFTQFGTITHLRLARSKKTGASKHYAFVQFADADVARIVAQTMDKYLMFGHILRCARVPPGQVHPDLWRGADRRFKPMPRNRIEGRELKRERTREEWAKRIRRVEKRRESRRKGLEALGYEFEPPRLVAPEEVRRIEASKEFAEDGGTKAAVAEAVTVPSS